MSNDQPVDCRHIFGNMADWPRPCMTCGKSEVEITAEQVRQIVEDGKRKLIPYDLLHAPMTAKAPSNNPNLPSSPMREQPVGLTLASLKMLGADPKVQDAVRDPTNPFSIAWHKREKEHRAIIAAMSEGKAVEQPVDISLSDIENAIKNAQPERIIVRQEIRQREGQPIEVLHEKVEFRVTAAQQALAVMEFINSRAPVRESVNLSEIPNSWQPIETAPRDGTKIWIWYTVKGKHPWSDKMIVKQKQNGNGGWMCCDNGMTLAELWKEDWEVFYWMPLPQSPEKPRRGRDAD